MFKIIDDFFIRCFAKIAHQNELLENLYLNQMGRLSFKILPIVAVLWVIWFSKRDTLKARYCAVVAVTGGILALAIGRLIQNLGPERVRHLHSGHPDYVMPHAVEKDALEGWSSFPSDHAALVFALSTGIFLFSRPLGAFCFFWSFFIVSLARVYAGYHYMTDIIGGALVGILSTAILYHWKSFSNWVTDLTLKFEERYTGAFYALLFFAAYQLTTMFHDVRGPIEGLLKYVQMGA